MIRALISYSLIVFSLILSVALATFSPNQAAGLSSSADINTTNWLAGAGSQIAEAFILFYGQASWLWAIFSLIIGLRLIFGISPKNLLAYFFSMQYLSVLTAVFLSCAYSSESYREGGIFGVIAYQALKSVFPDIILQGFFGMMLIISLMVLSKLPLTVWKKIAAYRQAFQQRNNAEEWIYVDEQPVEIFEEPIDPSPQDQTFYLNKKRLTQPEEPSFLRDANVDLTDSYKKSPNPFYDVLEENRLELDDMPEIPTEYTIAPDSLDELENVKVFRIPAVERSEDHKKYMPQLPDDYNLTEDFVKPAHKTIRLSFDEGFIDAVEYGQESARHLKQEEAHIRRTDPDISELDNELYGGDEPEKPYQDILISDMQYMQTLSLSDNDVAFDKMAPRKEILLDEYGFYKGEKYSLQDVSEEEITDPHRLILPEIFEPPARTLESQELTEEEALLVDNLDYRNHQKAQQKHAFQEKILRKQQELTGLYHSQHSVQGEVIFDEPTEQNNTPTSDQDMNFSIFDSEAVEELGDEIRLLKGNNQTPEPEPEIKEVPIFVFDDFFLEQDKIPISVPEYDDMDQEFEDVSDPGEEAVSESVEIPQMSQDLLHEMIMPEPSDEMPELDEILHPVDHEEIKQEYDIVTEEENTALENVALDLADGDLNVQATDLPRDWESFFTSEPESLEFENELTDSIGSDIARELEKDRGDEEIISPLEDEIIEISGIDDIIVPEDQEPIQEFSEEKDTAPWENTDLQEKEIDPIVIESVGIDFLDEKFNTDEEESVGSSELQPVIEEIPNLIPEILDLDQNEAALLPRFTTQNHTAAHEDTGAYSLDKPTEIVFPKVEDLDPNLEIVSHELEDEEIEETIRMIEDTFQSFNIHMKVVDYSRGPAITRFELEPPPGLKLRTIRNLQDDLALQAGTSNIRIISPVEGRSYIGIEVPNKIRRQFLLREFIESVEFQQSDAALPLILGTDIGGKVLVSDLATTPHLLVAGTTGSGKSVYINALVMGLLFKLSADDLKFIMIDPKMVELELYNGIPHLLAPIITKPEEAMAALEWAVNEMDRRYKILSENSVRNIKEYQNLAENSLFRAEESGYEKLPYIVIIVDEFANLMLRSPKDTEKNISRLAAMARAVGMHLVVATQRPSVDVVTGVIKANFPCRVAFRVSSKIDSRTILDKNGAEALLGRGDMLFMSPEHMDTVRIQSPYVSGHDVEAVVSAVKKNGPPNYVIDFEELLSGSKDNIQDSAKTDALSDPLFAEVLRYAVDSGEISASAVQRRFRVGYNRASRLIETMKDLNIVMPPVSAGKGWQVLISKDQIADYVDF